MNCELSEVFLDLRFIVPDMEYENAFVSIFLKFIESKECIRDEVATQKMIFFIFQLLNEKDVPDDVLEITTVNRLLDVFDMITDSCTNKDMGICAFVTLKVVHLILINNKMASKLTNIHKLVKRIASLLNSKKVVIRKIAIDCLHPLRCCTILEDEEDVND
ncbi:hypothetical protein ACOME3_009583 [Neoechinorhynchus agilis]